MEALDKHNLAVFIRAREGYSWWFLQRDFDQVSRMAIPTVFADYNRSFEGQEALQKKQEELKKQTVDVSVGGGAVSLTMNGEKQITALKIAKDAIDPEDPEMLEDLITTAVNEAGKKADEMVQKSMSEVTGGLGLPGGMF